jgi:nucleoside-diphosphate-sugar epimerase
MSKKNIFVTGISGFIGRHLAEDLNPDKYFMYGLTRQDMESKRSNIQFITGDIFNIGNYSDILSSCEVIVNIAGEKKDQAAMQKTNVEGMKAVINECKKHPHLKFIHISTSGIYGITNHPETVLTEDSICFPNNTYERTKLEAEKLLVDSGIKYTILRPSNVFGEFDSGIKLLKLFNSLLQNRFYYLDHASVVNYVYVKQITYLVSQIMEKNLFTSTAYNVNAPLNTVDFIDIIRKNLNISREFKKLPKYLIWPIAKILDYFPKKFQYITSGKYRELTSKKFYSTEKIHKEISFDEKAFLDQGIHNLVSYYKKENLL